MMTGLTDLDKWQPHHLIICSFLSQTLTTGLHCLQFTVVIFLSLFPHPYDITYKGQVGNHLEIGYNYPFVLIKKILPYNITFDIVY